MFTSVTKKTFLKGGFIYLGVAIFCIVFTFIYEKFSYGESSIYMRLQFLAPLIGSVLFFLSLLKVTWLRNSGAIALFNSSVAIVVSACLVRGIVEVSGRTMTYDTPYWYAAAVFLVLSIVVSLFTKKEISQQEENNRRRRSARS